MARGPGGLPHVISVIIPNWNGVTLLRGCLESLREQTHPDYEIILADNASSDDSVDMVRREYPEVSVVQLQENLGYSGGVNAGLAAAKGDILALLNNDAEAAPTWLEELTAALDRHPDAGSVASKMLLYDRREVLNSAGDFIRIDGTPGNRGVWQPDDGRFDREEFVFGACGGAAAYRRPMLEQIGPFDEDMFMYCEDVDLAWRAQLAGWRCVYAPAAKVYHRLSATGGGVLAFDALKAFRGEAARARLRGQLAALAMIPSLLSKRAAIQNLRFVTDDYLLSILTPID
jgi:GT2 family glycosyltransferase